jgi:PAS domain S-box-containing protein
VAAFAQPPRILVVDDDEGLLILMAEALRTEGYEISTAESGTAALTRLAEQPPDLMLLDLKLKDVGGAALVKRLKRDDVRGAVPFVVVTGQGDEKMAVEMMKQGALDYVMKDSALLDLLPTVVKRALAAVERDRALAASEAKLRASEARYASAVRATNDGVLEWDITQQWIYFSDRWKEILGCKPEELPDTFAAWQEHVHPEDRERFDKMCRAFFASDETDYSLEYRLRHKDGSYRWILLQALLVRDASGRPLRLTGAHTDITERKQLEQEILRISDREQWRIGQDLHDGLGQQLTALELMCQSLKSDVAEARPDLAAQVERLGRGLREAIAQTRSLAHGLTPFMLDAAGLPAALAELVQRTASLGRAECRFVCPAPVTLRDSEAAGHLYRIAQEAVGNALKHAGADEIVVSLSGGEGVVHLEINDDGRGMPKTKKPGPGIGLQVMQHRANAIGAELTVESKRGKGVRVLCLLRRHP